MVSTFGCAPRDEITAYLAETEIEPPAPKEAVSLLAVMVQPRERQTWVFKVDGSDKAIAESKDEILKFLSGVAFAPEAKAPEPNWKLPDGWIEEAGNEMRYKSVILPNGMEISISFFKQSQKLLPNVNRWRGQLKRNPITEKELSFVSRPFKMDGVEGTLVEINGFRSPRRQPPEPFQYEKPEGWRKVNDVAMAQLAFRVGADKEIATISLSAAGGELEGNLNRWRKQVGLKEQPLEDLVKDLKTMKIAGQDAKLASYVGDNGLRGINAIHAAIFELDDVQWFLKLSGPQAAVERQKQNFEKFAASLKKR